MLKLAQYPQALLGCAIVYCLVLIRAKMETALLVLWQSHQMKQEEHPPI